ncbi:aminotransferase class III-fold pyridoxal phosphate-dependent enzyme [Dactylosporangium fulvum]
MAIIDQLATRDRDLRRRARKVIPNGMYGHMAVQSLPDGYPQFIERADGARIWDVDGREYLDLMSSWGPIVLGHRYPAVEEAVRAQAVAGDCFDGTSPRMVELAEAFVDLVPYADWAMFAKNGTDATTLCCTIARAHTGREIIVVARGAYHGAAPWCTPYPAGVTAADRQNLVYFEYNDIDSLHAAIAGIEDRVAAVIACPVRHDVRREQELAEPQFARALRETCDRIGALLVLDEVRTGFRLDARGSWESFGVRPDLSAWSKAIANGYALSAVLGRADLRDAAGRVYTTGSFWFSAVSMAASLATLRVVSTPAFESNLRAAGQQLRTGLLAQAEAHGFRVRYTGPVQMPLLTFADDDDFALGNAWASAAINNGVYVHPYHNWFLNAAHTPEVIEEILQRTDAAYAALAGQPVAERGLLTG